MNSLPRALVLGLCLLGGQLAAPAEARAVPSGAQPPGPLPFSAHYDAYWKSIAVGTSDLKLERDTAADRYVYTWTITAHGIFRLVYRNPVTQRSWLQLQDEHVRPLKYHGDDGSAAVDLDFDWEQRHARGTSEGKPVDLALQEGTQDVMSIQIEIMLALRKGSLPHSFQIIDNDEVKEFNYAEEGSARLRTPLGDLDTLIVASRRTGSNRILRMWFAPALGFVPVQAERSRDGKLEFAMRIKTLQR